MSDRDQFETDLKAAFVDNHDASPADAASAAEKATAFREEFDADLTAADVLAAVEDAPYPSFTRRFNAAIGAVAAAEDDCTDSRAYRFAGFGDLAADPEQGA